MLRERGREMPQSGAGETVDPAFDAPRVLGEIRGAADADALIADEERRIAAQSDSDAQRAVTARESLTRTGRKAWEHVLVATPNQRAADTIEKAAKYLGPDANAEQLRHVENHIQGFERDAVDFLTRGDTHGLDRAITAFWNGVRDADKLATPKPPLMPTGENVFYNAGWSTQEEIGLRNILRAKGDRCTSIDSTGATLAGGARISKKDALEAYIPPAGGQQITAGSLPQVLADIKRREQRSKCS